MKSIKIKFIFLSLALMFTLSACGQKEEEVQTEIEEIEDITDIMQTDADAVEGEGETEETQTYVIDDDSLLSIVMDVLPDDDFSAECYSNISLDGNTYAVFKIKKDDALLNQQLAVNDETGQIFVFDEQNSEMLPFDEFDYYDLSKDPETDWNGTFINDNYVINIEMTDPGNFQYSVKKGLLKAESGVAYQTDYANAESSSDKGTVHFEFDGDNLIITAADGQCAFAGEYKRTND